VDGFVEWALRTQTLLADCSTLTAEESYVRELLSTHLAGALRTFVGRGEAYTSPAFYLQAGLDGLEALQLQYAERPWDKLRHRLVAFPRLLKNARNRLDSPPRLSVMLAQEMAEEALESLREQFDHSEVPQTVREASWKALQALEGFREWLESIDSVEFQPMGRKALDKILRREHLLDRGSTDWERMARTALEALPRLNGTVDASFQDSVTKEDVWQYYLDELHRVEAFVRNADIVSIPQGELRLCQTPAYLASLIPGAYYQEPALFAGERIGRFYLPSFPSEWTEAVQARYLARQRRGGFANLVVHEAWPGHHLQYLHAAENHQPLANVRDNDVMLEGWALYCEGLMEELGLFPQQPFPPRVDSLRLRLARVIVDIGLHTGDMNSEQAEGFMGQSLGMPVNSWIRAEVRRYCLEPSQPMSYWLGLFLIEELKLELGVTRETLKSFHDRLLSHGPVPIALIRKKVLGDR
jgi:uncharacterized protein DUF885